MIGGLKLFSTSVWLPSSSTFIYTIQIYDCKMETSTTSEKNIANGKQSFFGYVIRAGE